METEKIRSAIADIESLSVFAGLRQTPLVGALGVFLRAWLEYAGGRTFEAELRAVAAWAAFSQAFARSGKERFCAAVEALLRHDENPWTLAAELGLRDNDDSPLAAAAAGDLNALDRIASFDFGAVAEAITALSKQHLVTRALVRVHDECMLISGGKASRRLFFQAEALARNIRARGAGLFCGHAMFFWDGAFRPAFNPDPVNFAALSGYESERELVAENTRRFLDGGAANNLLLYGDRGTGKSATVKAVCNEYAARGLRLVELRKRDFPSLPAITSLLGRRGLKFILFIDDLSFEAQDDSFMTLKALLEGGIEKKPDNIIVYATSNRRHFVKEKTADRPAGMGDARGFDTMQEQLSLSDRFGLTVVFASPTRERYLDIAAFIARARGILPPETADLRNENPQNDDALRVFRENAVIWERWFNGRSPRTAGQYVRWLAAGRAFPWD